MLIPKTPVVKSFLVKMKARELHLLKQRLQRRFFPVNLRDSLEHQYNYHMLYELGILKKSRNIYG